MSCKTLVRRSTVTLRPLGRRSHAVAAAALVAAAAAALPSVSRGQTLVVDNSAANSPYTFTSLNTGTFTGVSVGDTTAGVLLQTGGTLTCTGTVFVGNASNSVGLYNLTGGAALVANTSAGGLIVGNAGAGTVNAFNTSNINLGTNSLSLGNVSGGSGTINIGGTAVLNSGTQYVGYSGTGVVNQTGGTFGAFNGSTYYSSVLGFNAGATGTYNLLGGTYAAYNIFVGYSGTGTFNQVAGSTVSSIGGLILGQVAGSAGTATITGGTTTFNSTVGMQVGASGAGVYNQTAGTVNFSSGSALIGVNAGSSGLALISGGTYQCSGAYVGYSGSGTLQLSGGAIVNAATQFTSAVGYLAGSTGTFNLSAGTFNALTTYIGYSGTGVLNQVGGTFNTGTSSLYLARGVLASTGLYNMTGGVATVANIYNGYNGSGNIIVNGGTLTVSNTLYEAYSNAASIGTVAVGGTGTINVSGSVYVNFNGAGSYLNVSGGVMNVTGTLYGQDNAGVGTVNLTGGTVNAGRLAVGTFSTTATGIANISGGAVVNVSNGVFIGSTDIGVLTQTGGILTVGTLPVTLGNASTGVGTYNLAGGTLATIGVAKGAGTGTLLFSGGTLQANASSTTFVTGLTAANVLAGGAVINSNGFNVSVGQPLVTGTGVVADGGLTKLGAGTLSLTGANTYSGPTNVSAGTLRVNTATGTTSGAYTVAAGATLGGSGNTGSGAVTINSGAFIATGADNVTIGTLTTGPETWNGNASTGGLIVKSTGATTGLLVMSGLTISPATTTALTPFFVTVSNVSGGAASLTSGQTVIIATDSNTAPVGRAQPVPGRAGGPVAGAEFSDDRPGGPRRHAGADDHDRHRRVRTDPGRRRGHPRADQPAAADGRRRPAGGRPTPTAGGPHARDDGLTDARFPFCDRTGGPVPAPAGTGPPRSSGAADRPAGGNGRTVGSPCRTT